MTKKYNILYLDPAWKYNARNNKNTKFGQGVDGHYPTMTIEEIKQIPVNEMADDNCALLMWCTFPQLDKQIQLFKHWGFDYKTIAFDWIKTNKINGFPFFGVGYYAKSNAEVCLLGVKGKMKPISNKVSSVLQDFETIQILSPRQEHSRKPAIVRDLIVELFGDLPRAELFARQKVDGWDSIGNETDGTDFTKWQEKPQRLKQA